LKCEALNFEPQVWPVRRSEVVLRARGFTIIEVLIVVVIVGILATVVIPQFNSASQQARENTLKDELRYLRTQITVFKAQHQDVPPGYPSGIPTGTPSSSAFIAQMTENSDINCNVSVSPLPNFMYGPYLSQMPANPINGMSSVEVISNNQTLPSPDGTTGWVYQAQTQEIFANVTGNDSSGTPFANY
jgi:prepilin-type N-terminal cleavage/methylation domain-containing protein